MMREHQFFVAVVNNNFLRLACSTYGSIHQSFILSRNVKLQLEYLQVLLAMLELSNNIS